MMTDTSTNRVSASAATSDDDGVGKLLAFHDEARRVLEEFQKLAASTKASVEERKELAGKLNAFLMGPMFEHEEAEAALLLPMLEQVALAEAQEVAAGTHRAHSHLTQLRRPVELGLKKVINTGELTPEFLGSVGTYADMLHRHLAAEEAMVYPLARRVLTPEDQKTLGTQLRNLQKLNSELLSLPPLAR